LPLKTIKEEVIDANGFISSYTTTQLTLDDVWLIVLNTSACQTKNTALFEVWGDPGDMLKWLEENLKLAREQNKVVFIAGHLSPG